MRCVAERLVGHVMVLDLRSRAMLGDLGTEVTDTIARLVSRGHRLFILNLDGVSSLDSNGLGDLVGARAAVAAVGGTIKLARVHERVAHPLRIMNLSRALESFDSEEDALESFGEPGAE